MDGVIRADTNRYLATRALPTNRFPLARLPVFLLVCDMRKLSFLTEQVADWLREGIREGRWRGTLPGRYPLAEQLGCSHWTVDKAVETLVKEGLLVSQGSGRPKRIQIPKGAASSRTLRVMILLYEESDRSEGKLVEMLHKLHQQGHEAEFAKKTMSNLCMDSRRITRFVKATEADAWVVVCGSRDTLKWFHQQGIPCFAYFGFSGGLPLPAIHPVKIPALRELTRRLIGLGHRRIVLLIGEEHRQPEISSFAAACLEEIEAHGIPVGPYNLPDWTYNPQSLQQCLDSLFRSTPPTALIVDQSALMLNILQFLAARRLCAPEDVSLVCLEDHASFHWSMPAVTHLHVDRSQWVNRVVKWVGRVAAGKEDQQLTLTKAVIIEGGTIGPVAQV